MARKRVAISQRVEVVPSYGEVRDCLDQEWTAWIESLDMMPILVPNKLDDVAGFCDALAIDAIFLSGGNNFSDEVAANPIYEDSSVEVSDGSPERDATEQALVTFAVERELPLIAWCRGMQVLQVYFGGQLCRTAKADHVATDHDIEIVSPHHQGLDGATINVNSYHDFGVRRSALAPPLLELAICSGDDLVEAVYHPELPIVGCQWHPERAKGGGARFNRALVNQMLYPKDSS